MKSAFARSVVRSLRSIHSAIESLDTRALLTSVYYVDANAPGSTTNGATWDTAYLNVQAALGVATSGDEIRIADGTYKPTTLTTRSISFDLSAGVKLYGGYQGYTGPSSSTPGTRNIGTYPSILSGDIGVANTASDNSYHVVTTTNASARLDGLTITCGYADGSSSAGKGGGLFSTGQPTIEACTFTENFGTFGGAVHNDHADVGTFGAFKVNNTAFTNNTATNGGAFYNDDTDTVFRYCTFSNNSATTGAGGAIYSKAISLIVLRDCTLTDNAAYTGGGGVYSTGSVFEAYNSLFQGGTAGSSGGAISNTSSWGSAISPVKLRACSFIDNSAGTNGGALSITNDNERIYNCSFVGNSAAGKGGAIYVALSEGDLDENEDIIPGLSVTNCTLTANSVSSSGNGGAIYVATASTLAVENSILWGNGANSGGEIKDDASSYLSVSINHTDIDGGQGTYSGSNNINSDPLFVQSPDLTLTNHFGNLELRIGSPAVDEGDDALIPGGDGHSFTAPGDIVGQTNGSSARKFGDYVDMGAYEQWTNTWVGSGTGSWSNTANWSLSRVPNQYDVASIGSGVTVQVNSGLSNYDVGQLVSFSNVQISGRTLQTHGDTSITGALTLSSGGSLDIREYTLTINFSSSPESTLRGYLASAYNGGDWAGTGLTSSRVQANAGHKWRIGYFNGNTDTVGGAAANQMIFKPLLAGDADGDGEVGADDLDIVDNNYHATANWAHGDLDYDNYCDSTELFLVAQQYDFTDHTDPLWD